MNWRSRPPLSRVCYRSGCGRARHAGLPVCITDWRRVPEDLQERVRWAREEQEDPEAKRATWMAVTRYLEEEAGPELDVGDRQEQETEAW